MAAEKSPLPSLRKAHCIGVGEDPTPRRQKNYRRVRLQRLDGFEKWLRFHDHPGATAVWCIVDSAVLVVGKVPKVDEVVRDTASRGCPRWYAQPKRPLEKIGEDGDDVDLELHRSVFRQSGVVQKSELVVDDNRSRVAI